MYIQYLMLQEQYIYTYNSNSDGDVIVRGM